MSNDKVSAMIERNKQMYWPVEWVATCGSGDHMVAFTPMGEYSLSDSGDSCVMHDPFGENHFYTNKESAQADVQAEINSLVQRVLDGLVVA